MSFNGHHLFILRWGKEACSLLLYKNPRLIENDPFRCYGAYYSSCASKDIILLNQCYLCMVKLDGNVRRHTSEQKKKCQQSIAFELLLLLDCKCNFKGYKYNLYVRTQKCTNVQWQSAATIAGSCSYGPIILYVWLVSKTIVLSAFRILSNHSNAILQTMSIFLTFWKMLNCGSW